MQCSLKLLSHGVYYNAAVLPTIHKGSFLNMLKGRKSEEKKWPVLKEDFTMKAEMRDWGEEEEVKVEEV